MNPTIKELWDFVRENFFPRWDRSRQWRFAFDGLELNGALGKCDYKTKTIVLTNEKNENRLLFLAIHEVCHAVTDGSHRKKFQIRLKKAEQRAVEMNLNGIADLLRQNIHECINTPNLRARDIYTRIEHYVYEEEAQPDDFIKVVDFLRLDISLSRNEFLNRYKMAEKVFLKAIAENN